MKKFPFYPQFDSMDCGPTCLRMITRFYGKSRSLQSLRNQSGLTREGVSLLGISEAAEKIGFHTVAMKVSYDSFINEAPLPCIVHWNQEHFVVVYAIRKSNSLFTFRRKKKLPTVSNVTQTDGSSPDFTQPVDSDKRFFIPDNPFPADVPPSVIPVSNQHEDRIYIADPGKGLGMLSGEDFCRSWGSTAIQHRMAGVALFIEPTPAFYETEDERSQQLGLGRLLGYLRPHRHLIGQLGASLLLGSGLQLLLPFLTQSIVDVGISSQNLNFIYVILAAQLSLMLGRTAVDFLRSWILLHISSRVNIAILTDFLAKLMRLPMSFFDSKNFGDLLQRVNDHQRIEAFLTGQSLQTVFSLINLLVFSVVLAKYSWLIFTLFVIGSLLYGAWVALFLKQQRKLDFKLFNLSASNQGSLVQILDGMQEIKLHNSEQIRRWEWERLQARLLKLQIRGLSLTQFQQAGAVVLNEGKNILITFVAAKTVLDGQMTLGAMMAVQYIIGQLNAPIDQLIQFLQTAQYAQLSMERLNEIHQLPDEEGINGVRNDVVKTSLLKPAGLFLQNLSFQYPGAGTEPVLKNIDLHIPPGRVTAIVGMSGSGKTTLLKLLMRFYEPTQGDIRIGAVRLSTVGHRAWRNQCGSVMQDGYIFSDTIARNIAVADAMPDPERLWHAIEMANISDLIDRLPLGLNTKIGATGNGISQGQKQRILIARAIYKNPDYLFFDEATNSLDAKNEFVILENMQKFFQGRTVVVVAHRLSTVRHADQIVVLDRGVITEVGTHETLTARQGEYYGLVKNQLELGA